MPAAVDGEIKHGSKRDPARKWLDENGKARIRDIGAVDSVVLSWKLGPGAARPSR